MSHRTKSALISGKAETWHNEIPCCGWKFDGFFFSNSGEQKRVAFVNGLHESSLWNDNLKAISCCRCSRSVERERKLKEVQAFVSSRRTEEKVMLCSCYSLDSNLIESVWQSLDKEEGFLSKFEGISKRKAKTGLCTHCKN